VSYELPGTDTAAAVCCSTLFGGTPPNYFFSLRKMTVAYGLT
jgi:hypothetical protein